MEIVDIILSNYHQINNIAISCFACLIQLKGNITNPINTSSSAEKKKMCLLGRESEDGTYDGYLRSQDEGNLDSLYTIVVDGNIASGKTTFLNLFKSYRQVLF